MKIQESVLLLSKLISSILDNQLKLYSSSMQIR